MRVDGGRSGDVILPRLQALGVNDLDAIVTTHPDADHVGGLIAVLGRHQVERIYINGDYEDTPQVYREFLQAVAAERSAKVMTLSRRQTVPLGGLQLPVLNPVFLTGDTNNDSIVLQLACGLVSVLFMGDVEQATERLMLFTGVPKTTVLKAGHHGSATSSSLPFLEAVRPEVAVISAGRTIPYGHPAPETLARLSSVGAKVVFTDTTVGDDSVTFTTNCQTYSFSVTPTSGKPITATVTATITATPALTHTASPPAGSYQVPACDRPGQNTCNCADFTTRSWAQWFHDTYDPMDINRLDDDHDGHVCESLPG